ncbi:hypothetical protein SAMN04515672_3330 [Natronorubrum texcoconense]|uniref:Uncharacterized protein n=1 Tax=Natronorubrum texcoconense TaxID=1095776 RepID=A0A1G9CWU6_9EURY|nr:hypothetical protein SAMN04515672_3330 [Natronorubrum texcoconense]
MGSTLDSVDDTDHERIDSDGEIVIHIPPST